ncbi:MAG: hypothetical protein LUE93_00190 [Bacteroides sp.]|nr:hypothetical protein [Bacteroides sp.]
MERLQSYFPQIKSLAEENPDYIYEGDQEAFEFFKENYLEYHAAQTSPTGKTYYLHPNRKGSVKLGEFWAKNLQKWLVEWGYGLNAL